MANKPGRPEGRVTLGIREALTERPEWSFDDLAHRIFGDNPGTANRSNVRRAIHALAAKGELIIYTEPVSMYVDGRWREYGQWVRRVDQAVA